MGESTHASENAQSFTELHDVMLQGIQAIFANKFQEGEAIFENAIQLAEARSKRFPEEPDLRSLTHVSFAFVAVFKGLAALENNQLQEVSERIKKSEDFLNAGPDWVGRSLARCACLLGQAAVLIAERKFMQGFWKAVRSPMYMNDIQRAREYEGVERLLIRSIALFTTAQLNFLLSYMPKFMLRMASWVTSFTGDRLQAMSDVETTWREGGFLAPSAGLDLLGKLLDSEERGVEASDQDWKLVEEILQWADKTFPESIFYVHMQSLSLTRKRKLPEASALLTKVLPAAVDYPAIGFLTHQLLADYCTAQLHWKEAAENLHSSLEVLRKVKRRANVPVLARQAAELYILVDDAVNAHAMVAIIDSYKGEKKTWDNEDKWAFKFADNLRKNSKQLGSGKLDMSSAEHCEWKPRLDVWKRLIMYKQLGRAMSKEAVGSLQQLISSYMETTSNSYLRCAAYALLADLSLQSDSPEAAIESCKDLRSCAEKNVKHRMPEEKRLKEEGLLPYAWHISARAQYKLGNMVETKDALGRIESFGHNYALHGAVMMRTALLQRSLGEKMVDGTCKTLEVKPWKKSKVEYDVTQAMVEGGTEVSWTFILDSHSVSIGVMFYEEGRKRGEEVAPMADHSAEDGPLVGSFKPESPGVLEVVVDNKASWTKSKTLTYCFDPADSEPIAHD